MATASSVAAAADHSTGSGYVSVWLRPPEQQAATGPAARAARAAGGKWALTATLGTVALASLLPEVARCLVSSCVPLWAILCAHYWFCLCTRGTFKASDGFVVALSGIVGDLSAGGVAGRLPSPAGLVASTAVWAAVCLSACAVAAPRALGVLPSLAALRLVALVTLVGGWPCWVRATVGHLCGLCGLLAARFTEAQLRAGHVSSLVSPDGRLLAVRRRRTGSSPGLHGLAPKGRRTSLPVLGQRQQYYGPGYQNFRRDKKNRTFLDSETTRNQYSSEYRSDNCIRQGSSSTVDVALLAEAHGLVTDMLLDPNLPPHVVSGLRALATLLSPPSHGPPQPRPRPGGASVSLADFNCGSDTEEIPYTGERPSALPKRLRRNLPPGLLRRMSTSTWTTTTSATGMPTLEPEPSRKRSTSFRHAAAAAEGSAAAQHQAFLANHAAASSGSSARGPASGAPSSVLQPKGRSFSTTAIPSSALSRRGVRERKTVCSLHPLSLAAGTTPGAAAGEAAASADQQQQQATLPSVRRLHTSDYDSSNDSPSGSDTNDPASGPNVLEGALRSPQQATAAVATATTAATTAGPVRCGLCGARVGATLAARPRERRLEDATGAKGDEDSGSGNEGDVDRDEGGGLYVGDTLFLPDEIVRDPLLGRIAEWDYPIFDLNRLNPDTILSKMCYRVFLEVGLFDAFKIPEPEFLHYFHALESGYREKPYHNRMHAADVLHGVYYLTSQAIPGFTQVVPDTTDSPLHKTAGNFLAEETYGIMGANFPALELMALYTAAAMHDYDHPGRTNAFLVSTYAPQAVLYNDRSVLENYHAASAWTLFLSESNFNFLVHLDKAEFKRFRFLVIECILATDLKRHFEILAEFNAKANDTDAPGIDWNNETDRLLVMEMAIKLADINGPCKRHDIHVQWTYRIAEEFYEQGDEEATLGMQVSPFMDRCNPQLAKLQESFINHLVAPLCNAYGEAGLLPGHWVEASDSEDEGGTDKTDSQTGRDTEEETEGETSASGRPWKRPSQQLQPRKVSCLQTQHLQDNYEHWVNILKEENRLKEQQQQQQQQGAAAATAASSSTSPRAATAPAAEDDHAASEDEDDDGDDGESDDCDDDDDDEESQAGVVGADVVVAAAPSPHQDEMETIQEVEEGALGGQGSTKTSPCSGSC
ncbi:cGMP-inhibited 3',5'-cyclic phosphodiesterase A isoform X2 [Dermacentor silvarum]|uniref:cGMP-inhibited 3',5'-cyclic phosphodiesterase A isoform X2 n=1 Tax=Dermacentor silvarum TaxID=543639 RepID=UPI002100E853|nr:cGMP-inhibited 3',5'-cyclic phosphodiesterase A isoform X2 [Dermacentor silvarum]